MLRTTLTIGSMAILARLLTPADFGYLAMATVVTEFAGLLGSFGFANILIQRRVITRLQLDTMFWATLALGCTIAAVIFALSFLTHWLFGDEATGPLLRVMCLTFIFGSLSTVHQAILSRLMRFGTEFIIRSARLDCVLPQRLYLPIWASASGAWCMVRWLARSSAPC